MDLHFGESFKLNLVRMEWISFLENPSNSLRALMSQCQTTHIVSYYHPLFITLSHTLSPIDFICHLSFIFTLSHTVCYQLSSPLYHYSLSNYHRCTYFYITFCHNVSPYRLSAIIIHSLSLCQPKQMISYNHHFLITLSYTVSQHR